MRWTLLITASVLSLLQATLAHPAPTSYPNITERAIQKRSIVCGIDLRTAVRNDCFENTKVQNFKLEETQSRQVLTKEPVLEKVIPAGSSCGTCFDKRRGD